MMGTVFATFPLEDVPAPDFGGGGGFKNTAFGAPRGGATAAVASLALATLALLRGEISAPSTLPDNNS